MNNNLPTVYDNSLFGKIKTFFRNIFAKKQVENIQEEKVEEQPVVEEVDNKKVQFQESIKAETNNEYAKEMKREEILDKIENNPDILNNLSIEKLEKIEELLEESIKQQEDKLAKLKKAS